MNLGSAANSAADHQNQKPLNTAERLKPGETKRPKAKVTCPDKSD
jgi:hypothetical protein